MELQGIANEIRLKARELAEDFGADFVVELVGDYLDESEVRMMRLRQALAGGDATTVTYEAHTLKSSSANLGAQTFSDLAKRFEDIGREGNLALLEGEVESFVRQFAAVKASMQELRRAPDRFMAQER